ncbi:MAG: hypothetical protein GY856_35610, partial [bacterium]|nr:hypothetical protein [bacterium]
MKNPRPFAWLLGIPLTLVLPGAVGADPTPLLISYLNGASSEPTTLAATAEYRIAVDFEALERMPARAAIPLPDGSVLEMRRTAAERRGPGDTTWVGRWGETTTGDVVLTVKDGVLSGLL